MFCHYSQIHLQLQKHRIKKLSQFLSQWDRIYDNRRHIIFIRLKNLNMCLFFISKCTNDNQINKFSFAHSVLYHVNSPFKFLKLLYFSHSVILPWRTQRLTKVSNNALLLFSIPFFFFLFGKWCTSIWDSCWKGKKGELHPIWIITRVFIEKIYYIDLMYVR